MGLTASFLLAGFADSLELFAAALVLQGVLGGTFAASNGYLGATLQGAELSRALTLMQGSARAALVCAPIVVGALTPWLSPHRQYALLAVLPLTAAGMLAVLPEPPRRTAPAGTPDEAGATAGVDAPGAAETATDAHPHSPAVASPAALRSLYTLEFVFVFSTVISFPYLISLVEERLPGTGPVTSGVLFALPHMCYLVGAMAAHRFCLRRPHLGLVFGFACIAAGSAGHAAATSLAEFAAVRLVLGAGLTLGLVGLSVRAADCAAGRAPGGLFGSIEFFSKAGAVAAGLAAAAGNAWFGPSAPLLIGTALALATVVACALPVLRRPRLRRSL